MKKIQCFYKIKSLYAVALDMRLNGPYSRKRTNFSPGLNLEFSFRNTDQCKIKVSPGLIQDYKVSPLSRIRATL